MAGSTPEKASVRGPLTIYVVWHPRFQPGAELARGVHGWFRTLDGAVSVRGSEIPVYYRSEPWSKVLAVPDQGAGLPSSSLAADESESPDLAPPYRALALRDARTVVVLALVDAEFARDPDFRAHLYALAQEHRRGRGLLLVPVELGPGLSSLHPVVSGINAIRVDHWLDGDEAEHEGRLKRRAVRLRRHLTQVLVRHFRESAILGKVGPALLPRTVFLSHAKGDREHGVGVAETIQREALALGQVDTFLDATNLDWAREWEKPMIGAAGSDAAALVAIVSDQYASRFWCRRELQAARRPRRLRRTSPIWWVQPIVAVDTLKERWTRSLPELSGVPMVRWRNEEDCAASVLDRLMLEALQALVHVQYNQDVAAAMTETRGIHFLSCSPEPYVLTEWYSQLPRRTGKQRVVYPGHGLMPGEDARLEGWFGRRVEFRSIDEVVDDLTLDGNAWPAQKAEQHGIHRGFVALSVGDPPPDELNALGMGVEHMHEALFRIGRAVLGDGTGLAFGGALQRRNSLMDPLLDAAAVVVPRPSERAHGRDPIQDRPARVRSYLAWPQGEVVSASDEARLLDRCQILRFNAMGVAKGEEARRAAEAKSVMRRQLAQDCGLMLAMGGRRQGSSGWVPGVLEEIAEMALADKPVIPLAMFGGAARSVVAWLLGSRDALDELLDASQAAAHPSNLGLRRLLECGDAARDTHRERLDRVRQGVDRLLVGYDKARRGEFYHGIDFPTLKTLMTTDSVRVIRRQLRWNVIPKVFPA